MGIFSRNRYAEDRARPPRDAYDRRDGYNRDRYDNRGYQGDGRDFRGDDTGYQGNNQFDRDYRGNNQYDRDYRGDDQVNRGTFQGNDRNDQYATRGVNDPNQYDRRDYDRNDHYDRRNRQSRWSSFSSFGRRDRHHNRLTREKKTKTKTKRPLFDIDSGDFNRRPSFGQWLKFTVLDIVTMAAMGAVGLGIYYADPAPSRSFPITFSDSTIVYPQFAYPLRHEIVPIWEAALLASLIPIAVILLMQIRVRSFWDVNNAVIGLLYSLITAAVFQVWVKWLIGGLRPHFLYVCAPDLGKVSAGGQGFQSIMFQRDVCTGDRDEINDSLESMPSGHSTAAWAGFLYLYFYLNAKLKVFANYHPAMWKLVVTYAPILGACLITGSLTIDEYHNWYDCLAGAIIGSVMAISSYRMVYASVWDFRFNHIPLTRHTPFSYGAGEAGAGGFESAVFTRKAGWGFEEAYGGAPFDAARHLRGQAMGFNTQVTADNNNKVNGHTGTSHGIGHGNTVTGATAKDIEHHDGVHRGRGVDADGFAHDDAATATAGRDYDRYHRDGDIEHHAATVGPTSGTTTGAYHNNTTTAPVHDTTTGPMHTTTAPGVETGPRTGPATVTGPQGARVGDPSPNRYRPSRKSLERKSLPPTQTPPPHPSY